MSWYVHFAILFLCANSVQCTRFESVSPEFKHFAHNWAGEYLAQVACDHKGGRQLIT